MKNERIVKLLSTLPSRITLWDIEACFVLAALAKNDGNKTRTCKKIRMSVRNMRYKIRIWEDEGYHIPEYVRIYKRKDRLPTKK